jgi:hypothetical protein
MDPALGFEVWRMLLRADCVRNDKLLVFENFGEPCLEALWEAGIEPSVEAISNTRSAGKTL